MEALAVILAAGKGVRMKSDIPKVMHKILGRPMLSFVIDAVKESGISRVLLVVGYMSEMVKDHFKGSDVTFVEQKERLGTGHAVMQAEPYLKDFLGTVVVLAGDMPLISSKTIKGLLAHHSLNNAKATVLTAKVAEPFGYGRIVRGERARVLRIVEERDAESDEKKIKEINSGVYCFECSALLAALKEIKPENDQKEYYLTDTIEILNKKGLPVFAFTCDDPQEAIGVNTKEELLNVEKILKKN
jgi:UDP-N-acetylglucosamine diphosphorylase/glucosamine-1-phosphate N-acetyltransferase